MRWEGGAPEGWAEQRHFCFESSEKDLSKVASGSRSSGNNSQSAAEPIANRDRYC